MPFCPQYSSLTVQILVHCCHPIECRRDTLSSSSRQVGGASNTTAHTTLYTFRRPLAHICPRPRNTLPLPSWLTPRRCCRSCADQPHFTMADAHVSPAPNPAMAICTCSQQPHCRRFMAARLFMHRMTIPSTNSAAFTLNLHPGPSRQGTGATGCRMQFLMCLQWHPPCPQAGCCRRRPPHPAPARSCSMQDAVQCGSEPRTVSPGWMLPPRTASSSASGMEAALVLPYSARLLITRSGATCGQANPNMHGVRTLPLAWVLPHLARWLTTRSGATFDSCGTEEASSHGWRCR
jgi:hypothetical protein